MNPSEDERSRKMAEALLKGWKMLPEVCPVCGTPLFETSGGEVICAVCGTKVILVGSEEEVGIEEQRLMLERVMGALMRQLERETLSSSELDDELLSRINSLLNAIEKATSIYRNLVRLGKRRR
ncbi:hypothetical protein D9Q81_04990 [Candidatus Korarchaeum cryptofilum]|jgi:uncharacterized Zn finger protein (UPF0148 family)|uniref:Sjogrens syndrome scleroderma autoantigen 1 n=2 Tax=Candidatus Korarchaeum cryptofilum TaxID=498846 RepID=B1L6U2_KORCO|nr:Sjogren's syndrome/scleroderma autoantigen 1 family protein [Candidatus Korarchaeum cryptofilum]ACB08171.1 Sjogrens syndrome scleroderma autoantigen 1 [Candidatus Korarchaeum cryptofilum OPF8]RSN68849.1 hypothetical protein D9Q81_04990 [Candidatus Korarchaeum cryptofilum]